MMMEAEMYGMIPSAKTVKRDNAPPEKHVEQAQDAALLPLEKLLQLPGVDSWNWNMRANPIHNQGQQQEHQTTTQVAEFSCLCKLRRVSCH